jgi:hypothetical protein
VLFCNLIAVVEEWLSSHGRRGLESSALAAVRVLAGLCAGPPARPGPFPAAVASSLFGSLARSQRCSRPSSASQITISSAQCIAAKLNT